MHVVSVVVATLRGRLASCSRGCSDIAAGSGTAAITTTTASQRVATLARATGCVGLFVALPFVVVIASGGAIAGTTTTTTTSTTATTSGCHPKVLPLLRL